MNINSLVKWVSEACANLSAMLSGGMISAIVWAPEKIAAMPVARSLAALVPLVVSGLVRDVRLAAPPEFGSLADEAGCGLSASLEEAVAAARGPWLLILQAGFAPQSGFAGEAEDFIAAGQRLPGVLRQEPAGFFTRLAPHLAPPAAILLTKEMLLDPAAKDLVALARAAGASRTLAAQARRTG